MGTTDPRDVGESLCTVVGEVHGIEASILRIVTSFDETFLLQLVEQENESARNHSEERGQPLLALPRCARDRSQETGMRRGQVDFAQTLGESHRRERSDLSEQKRGARTPELRFFRVLRLRHAPSIVSANELRNESFTL